MEGAGVLNNTYWIRYAHRQMTFDLDALVADMLANLSVKLG